MLIALVQAAISGEISVGAFAAVFSSISLVFSVMEAIIIRNLGVVSHNIGQAKNFLSFLKLPESKGEIKQIDVSQGIEMRNVCFRYPGSDYYALENINLSIAPGETIAIVGENGAGKSTLIKLLAGIYRPTEGEVNIGGESTKAVQPSCYYRFMSAAFQKFQRYKLSLRDNVEISDFNQKERDTEEVLNSMDLYVEPNIFSEGMETILSSEFDGVDISGGLWQRIAIARALYRKCAIIFLDEPTAAIDPIEESKVYKQFSLLSQNKMAIIITHRLGSAKIADRILVMDKGQIIETGTHEELINQNGKYAMMYQLQAGWYIDNED